MAKNRTGEPAGELTISAYLDIAKRRKWWVILSALGVFLAITVYAQRLPDIYRAETVILVDAAQVPDKYVPTINTGDIAGRLTTLQQQVLSPTRLKRLVESEGMYPDPTGKRTEEDVIRAVQKAIVVDTANQGPGKTSTFRIAYSGRQQDRVARVANALAQMFIDENVKARVDQTEDTAQFLEDQLQETKRQLDEKDAQMRGIQSHNILEMPEAKQYHMEALANLRAQVQTIHDKIDQDQREKSMIESVMLSGNGAPTVDVDGPPTGGHGGAGYQNELQKLEAKLSLLKQRYGPSHPDVRKAQAEVDRLQAKAASEAPETEEHVDVAPAVPVQRRRNPVLEAQIEKLNEDIRAQNLALRPLQDRMLFHEGKLEQMPAFEAQITRVKSDYDILKTQYTSLLEKEKAAQISHALEVHQKGERFMVLDPAVKPQKPSAPDRTLYSLGGLFGGLLLGILLAAVSEVNDESVRTEGEAAQILGKPVLSGIPEIVAPQEVNVRRLKAFGMVACTAAGSVGAGFLISLISERLF
jgi:protein tyrosine kinase modulator